METVVLITGAWHGGWSWRPVASRLRAAGHRVYAPTMPGPDLGETPGSHEANFTRPGALPDAVLEASAG